MKTIHPKVRAAIYTHLRAVLKAALAANLDGRKLKKFGFVKHFYREGRCFMFISKKLDVVIKFPYLMCNRVPSKWCVPTVIVKNIRRDRKDPLDGYYGARGYLVAVQPIVDVNFPDKAYEKLAAANADDAVADFHRGNVGWYRGIPVVLDW